MKSIVLIPVILTLSFSLLHAQNSRFQTIDLAGYETGLSAWKATYFEPINDSISYLLMDTYLPIKNGIVTRNYILYKMQYNHVIDRKIILNSTYAYMRCYKIKDKYLIAGFDYNYQNQYRYAFSSSVYDQDFNLLKDTVLFLNDDKYCYYNFNDACHTGGDPMIYPMGDSIFLFSSLYYSTDSTKLFFLKYDENLDIVYKKEYPWRWAIGGWVSWQEYYYNSILRRDDGNFNFYVDRYLMGLDRNFNQLFWWDMPDGRFRVSALGEYRFLPEGDSIIIFGNIAYQNDIWHLESTTTIGKFDSKWYFNFDDSIHLKEYHILPIDTWREDTGLPPNGLLKLQNGNYLGILSKNILISGDTTSGRIIIAQFTPDLNIVCQKMYVYDKKKVDLNYVASSPDGKKFYVAGAYFNIGYLGNRSPGYPFVTYFDTDCNLPGATPIEEFLGLSNKAEQKNPYGIVLYPNPAETQIRLTPAGYMPNEKAHIRIYNMLGQELINCPWSSSDHTVDINGLYPGIYICTLSTAQGTVFAKSFVKQ